MGIILARKDSKCNALTNLIKSTSCCLLNNFFIFGHSFCRRHHSVARHANSFLNSAIVLTWAVNFVIGGRPVLLGFGGLPFLICFLVLFCTRKALPTSHISSSPKAASGSPSFLSFCFPRSFRSLSICFAFLSALVCFWRPGRRDGGPIPWTLPSCLCRAPLLAKDVAMSPRSWHRSQYILHYRKIIESNCNFITVK